MEVMREHHLRIIKRQIVWRYIFCGLLLFAIGFVIYLIQDNKDQLDQSKSILLYIFTAIVIAIVAQQFTRQLRQDINDKKLNLYVKTLDRKSEHEIIEQWIYRNRNKEPYIKYFFHSGGVSFRVEKEIYNKKRALLF